MTSRHDCSVGRVGRTLGPAWPPTFETKTCCEEGMKGGGSRACSIGRVVDTSGPAWPPPLETTPYCEEGITGGGGRACSVGRGVGTSGPRWPPTVETIPCCEENTQGGGGRDCSVGGKELARRGRRGRPPSRLQPHTHGREPSEDVYIHQQRRGRDPHTTAGGRHPDPPPIRTSTRKKVVRGCAKCDGGLCTIRGWQEAIRARASVCIAPAEWAVDGTLAASGAQAAKGKRAAEEGGKGLRSLQVGEKNCTPRSLPVEGQKAWYIPSPPSCGKSTPQ